MNDFTISQASTVLNAVVEQMTGQTNLAPITTPGQFVAVAQTLLRTGVDPVLNAISQVWSRSIFAVREYNAEDGKLRMSLDRYGNAIRKISPVASAMQDDLGNAWPVHYDANQSPADGNGESVDPFAIKKQEVLQTNFYGKAVYQQHYTVFKDQFDVAFSGPDEFMRFNAMNLTERRNDKESFEESISHGIQANYIGALLDEADTFRVVHLLTEYNTLTGQSLTANTVMQADNFEAFIRWMYSRIATIVRLMGKRSQMFQTVINNTPILRHTRPENLRVALYTPFMEMINSMVLSDLYHNELMKLPRYDNIDYFQSIEAPQAIKVTPVYTDANGALKNGSAVDVENVVGVLHDVDALGYAITREDTDSIYNPAARYWNTYLSADLKTICDVTEKGVVLCLD